ncbi:QacE family quaternary ammonium compound efflux SMR transporter [Bacillus pumilus]|uniref:DMT family transporter n=1 Tax=Bacillus pumilus TaxID=1408 RepID=UPI002B23EF31|nr:SMR family transporter [Bacillus pumilus]MEB2358415.1 QacE family quaternary ammonium compound efflux SMR transporter [Bacillus pumilus]
MGYVFLLFSIILGVSGQICVKLSKGFKIKVPTILAFILFITCIYFVSLATSYFEVAIVFAIWSGLTIVLTTTLGIILFKESKSKLKLISIVSILLGTILLELIP